MKTIFTLFILITFTLLHAQETYKDTDKDTIADKYDKCPNTPDGVCVTKDGCIQQIKRIIYFDSSSYEIKEDSINELKSINEISLECFGYTIEISGHTDSTADERFNKNLSQQRAKAVKKQIILNGIEKKRIKTTWYGETMPVTTNVTKEGRALNRRVEILFK